jgi:Kef-type K+ transport system membrane component KefB
MNFIENIYEFLVKHNTTINLLFMMVLIWTSGVLFRWIKQPPILGELLAGIIFGPPILGMIQPDETVNVLSELGVFFLMFYAGLESNPVDLKREGIRSIIIGLGSFMLPFVSGYFVCSHLGMTKVQSLFLGLSLSVTAIAVNARILIDLDLLRERISSVIMGASIVGDILILSIFTIILDLTSAEASLSAIKIAIILTKVVAFFTASILIGLFLYPYVGEHLASREAKGFTFALIMALLFGVMAEAAGLHIVLGAYMAGLFVREEIVSCELYQKINDRFVAIAYGFLGPIFFVSLSFYVTFDIFSTHADFIAILLATAIFSKILGAGGSALAAKMTVQEATFIGCAMNARGAVELVVASIGLKAGLIDKSIFSILVFIAFVTTIIPPILLPILYKRIVRKDTRGIEKCAKLDNAQ